MGILLSMIIIFFTFIVSGSAFNFIEDEYLFEEAPKIKTYSTKSDLDPVILVPGLASSRLQYKNNTGSTWGTLWLSIIRILNYKEWIKELTVDYDAESETYSSLSTITVRVEDYGGVDV